MRVTKPTIITSAFVMAAGLMSCRLMDVNHGSEVSAIEASTNADLQKSASVVNDSVENSVDKQLQEAEKNQASEKHAIYFLHDSTEIDSEFMSVIEKQSQKLLENSDYVLILEGHADERGSREYNIGLGEERAKAVAKIMQARGVSNEQLEIVSYGEEKPASLEHTETAWHLNRRVNLIPQRTQK